MDDDTGIFKLVPIADTSQRSIFDADFGQEAGAGRPTTEGTARPLLPGPEDAEDITDELLGGGNAEDDGEYGYDDPED